MSRSLQYVCSYTLLPAANKALSLLQAIAETEGEITKRRVQITAAAKQAEKLSKDCIKTQNELDKANADLEGKQQEQQVCTDRHQGLQKKDLADCKYHAMHFACFYQGVCLLNENAIFDRLVLCLSMSAWGADAGGRIGIQQAPCSTALQVTSARSWVLHT